MFGEVLIIGVLGVLCWNFGLQNYFIGIFIVAIILNEVQRALKQKEYSKAINSYKQLLDEKLDNEKNSNKKSKETYNELDKNSDKLFIDKNMIPVRIDKETGAYVICVEELINAIDHYYTEVATKYINDLTDNFNEEKDNNEDK